MSTNAYTTPRSTTVAKSGSKKASRYKIGDEIRVVTPSKTLCGFVVAVKQKTEQYRTITYTYISRGKWVDKIVNLKEGTPIDGKQIFRVDNYADFGHKGTPHRVEAKHGSKFHTAWQSLQDINCACGSVGKVARKVRTLLYTTLRKDDDTNVSTPVYGAAFFLGDTHVRIEKRLTGGDLSHLAGEVLTHQKRVVYMWYQYRKWKDGTLDPLIMKNVQKSKFNFKDEASFLYGLSKADLSSENDYRTFWEAVGIRDTKLSNDKRHVSKTLRNAHVLYIKPSRAAKKFDFSIRDENVAPESKTSCSIRRSSGGTQGCDSVEVLEWVRHLFGNDTHSNTMTADKLQEGFEEADKKMWTDTILRTLRSKHFLRIINAAGLDEYVQSNPFEAAILVLCGEILFTEVSNRKTIFDGHIFNSIRPSNDMQLYVMFE